MEAIIKTGGKQYPVKVGETIKVEKLSFNVGSEVEFKEVLYLKDGEDVLFGKPLLQNAKVKGVITEQGKGKKIRVFYYKNKTTYKRLYGHRQPFSRVKILSIEK